MSRGHPGSLKGNQAIQPDGTFEIAGPARCTGVKNSHDDPVDLLAADLPCTAMIFDEGHIVKIIGSTRGH
jgi:hypothetical protein